MDPITHNEPAPTLAEVWQLFKETDRRFQETERLLKEQSQETDRRFQETERLLKEQSQQTDRRFRETEQFFRQQNKELDKKLGKLGNRLGEFVEGFIKPAVVKLFQERGIAVHVVTRDVEVNRPELGLAMQIDLFVTNDDSCVLVEVKSHLDLDDVNEHIERMGKFKVLFPLYADKKIYGAVAGMVIPDNIAKYAYRNGFFVIAQKGDSAVILNDDKFNPTAW